MNTNCEIMITFDNNQSITIILTHKYHRFLQRKSFLYTSNFHWTDTPHELLQFYDFHQHLVVSLRIQTTLYVHIPWIWYKRHEPLFFHATSNAPHLQGHESQEIWKKKSNDKFTTNFRRSYYRVSIVPNSKLYMDYFRNLFYRPPWWVLDFFFIARKRQNTTF